jgi:hypothetical protein
VQESQLKVELVQNLTVLKSSAPLLNSAIDAFNKKVHGNFTLFRKSSS